MAPGRGREIARALVTPILLTAVFWTLAVTLSLRTGHWFFLFNFGYIGTALGVGFGLYAVLPRAKKPWGRRAAQFLVGVYMLGFLGFVARENMQIEGFLFCLVLGVTTGPVIHYAVAKIFGPLLWGRAFCGWACWTAMVLDLLPFTRSSGRAQKFGAVRYAVLAVDAGLVAALWFGARYAMRGGAPRDLAWLVAGNALYFATGIGLAFWFRDNRAFCKVLCPVALPMKVGAPLALLKIAGDADRCTGCGACDTACPMDVPVSAYVKAGRRVTSTECIFCQTCLNSCPQHVLRSSFGVR